MFEKFSKALAKKMGRSVKNTIQPVAREVKKTVDSKVDLYSRLLKLGVLLLLFIDGTKRVNNMNNPEPSSPNHIVINNYILKKEGDD